MTNEKYKAVEYESVQSFNADAKRMSELGYKVHTYMPIRFVGAYVNDFRIHVLWERR